MTIGQNPPFQQSALVTIAATTASAGASLPTVGDAIVVTNNAASLAWIALGGGPTIPTAIAGVGVPVLPASKRILAGGGVTQVAAILVAGAGSIFIEIGSGSAI